MLKIGLQFYGGRGGASGKGGGGSTGSQAKDEKFPSGGSTKDKMEWADKQTGTPESYSVGQLNSILRNEPRDEADYKMSSILEKSAKGSSIQTVDQDGVRSTWTKRSNGQWHSSLYANDETITSGALGTVLARDIGYGSDRITKINLKNK